MDSSPKKYLLSRGGRLGEVAVNGSSTVCVTSQSAISARLFPPRPFSERIALGTRLVLAFTDFSFFYSGFYTFIFVAQLDGLVRDTSSSKTTFIWHLRQSCSRKTMYKVKPQARSLSFYLWKQIVSNRDGSLRKPTFRRKQNNVSRTTCAIKTPKMTKLPSGWKQSVIILYKYYNTPLHNPYR